MNREDLVKNIKQLCEKKKVNVRLMEEELNFSPGLISRWVRMSPSVEKLTAVADYLAVSVDSLLGRISEASRENFIEKIVRFTREGKLSWFPCGFDIPFDYPVTRLKESRGGDWQCGYCKYGEGFFILTCSLEEEENKEEIKELRLYILPDRYVVPVFQDIEGTELLPLYDLVKQDIVWREDKARADELKNLFMSDSVL